MAKTDIFISYRRQGGEFLGRILYDELTKNGYSVFYDIESLNSGKFNEQIYHKIEECLYFLIILTPNCLDRCINEDDWVRLEYECALKNNKNIIPIMTRGFQFPTGLPDTMRDLPFFQGIEATAGDIEFFLKKLERLMYSNPETKTQNEINITKEIEIINIVDTSQLCSDSDIIKKLVEDEKEIYISSSVTEELDKILNDNIFDDDIVRNVITAKRTLKKYRKYINFFERDIEQLISEKMSDYSVINLYAHKKFFSEGFICDCKVNMFERF